MPIDEVPLPLADQVAAWASADVRARQDQECLQREPWYALGRRRTARARARKSAAYAQTQRAGLDDNAVERLAAAQVIEVWKEHAEKLGQRNPFHSDYEPTWMSRTAQLADETQRRTIHSTRRRLRSTEPTDIPGYVDLLTPAFVEKVLAAQARERHRVAHDPTFLSEVWTDPSGDTVMIVQHQHSGLRATFTIHTAAAPFGHVMSKPYSIDSIDPDNPGSCLNWADYAGLGIGTEIYRQAAALQPHVRWVTGAMSSYSSAVRRKLHAENPHRWAAHGCSWCTEHAIQWDKATPLSLAGHP